MARMDINVFTQIGFVVLVGLACKNAILIVEFCPVTSQKPASTDFRRRWYCLRLRLSPIIMTSFCLSSWVVVPLMIGQGAGARNAPNSGGRCFFAGDAGSDTIRHPADRPVFFYVIQWFADLARGTQSDRGVICESSISRLIHIRSASAD